ncbi:hypothetical protein UFOVP1608_22 [uncultured Caudovirales phage]|uniref:Uncharacterized protein n=1 Tax=uncultured Caudovirales phage TaxID=2100421 RepID=A0A6J5SST3_9CAUD|nr:hypothetical protein UFOVP1608_22 [uncultured Caudovirales phage]
MKIKFSVTVDNETKEVSTTYADVIALEEKFDIDASTLATRQRATWLSYLAWHALHRTGGTALSYEDFAAKVESVDSVESDPKG